MSYFLIKGCFHVIGFSPDGDSLMFRASNPKNWEEIPSEHTDAFFEKLNEKENKEAVQLRLQAIDALETHYGPRPLRTPTACKGKSYAKAEKPKRQNYHQASPYGKVAAEVLMQQIGIKDYKWGRFSVSEIEIREGRSKKTIGEKFGESLEGYVVVNDFDRNGRPIAWAFTGKTSTRDGTNLSVAQLSRRIRSSINYKLLEAGLVYPYFYMTLSAKLRDPMVKGMQKAYEKKRNLWGEDKSIKGLRLKDFSQLTEKQLIYPYLFRRIIKNRYKRQMEGYWEAVAKKKKYQVDEDDLFLEQFYEDSDPYIFLIAERDFVKLSQIVQVSKAWIRMKTLPSNIVFLS